MNEKLLAAICFGIVVCASVALTLSGRDPGVIIGIASGPLVGSLIAAFQGRKLARVDAKVAVIEKQTNGMLQYPLQQLAAGQAAAATVAATHEDNRVAAAGAVEHALRLRLAEDVAHILNESRPDTADGWTVPAAARAPGAPAPAPHG